MMIYEQTEFVFELFFYCFNLWYRRRQQETFTEILNLTMTLALNARIEYFDWTPRPMIVCHEIRFVCKRMVGSEDTVERVISEKGGNSSTIQHLWQ